MDEEAALYLPRTALRSSYERARSIPHDQQIQECVDLLSHPELLSHELLDAYGVIESFGESELDLVCRIGRPEDEEVAAELVLEHFYEDQVVTISREWEPDLDFRCLATDVRPVDCLMPSGSESRDGFDYIALPEPCESGDLPILGVAQTVDDSSPYPLLLRLLCSLSEIAPASQLNVVNTDLLKGALPPDPRFDLHMVLWDEGGFSREEAMLCELSRDLAEVARNAMAGCPALDARVRTIHCLRMDPRDFQGELEEMWSC